MELLNLFNRSKKLKYIKDRTWLSREYIESKFQFLVDNGYVYRYCEKYTEGSYTYEKQFAYKDQTFYVQFCRDGSQIFCIVQGKDVERTEIGDSCLVDESWKERFYVSTNIERLEMIIDVLKENGDKFFN